MNKTPRANRVHIAFYGTTNSGKSTLINRITKQKISLVSEVPGTTTDPVLKSMEIAGIGACVLMDTAGFDDNGELGQERVKLTQNTIRKADVAVVVLNAVEEVDLELYKNWIAELKQTPYLLVLNKCDLIQSSCVEQKKSELEKVFGKSILTLSANEDTSINSFLEELVKTAEIPNVESITKNLCTGNDVVMLVMPQDIQAPRGRLILPQVQTTRDLLDKQCIVISVTKDQYVDALQTLKESPALIITDSQVFSYVYEHKPKDSQVTSFSVLFAALKGDIQVLKEGAKAIESLTPQSKVLIAEACTHAPLSEDIGRVKIPQLLRKKVSPVLQIDVVSGSDFSEQLEAYDLVIHCGACMFNRKHMLSRIQMAQERNVSITNYGIAIAHLNGILDKIVIPNT